MHRYDNFWIVTFFRGALAVLFGLAILVIPQMARSLLLLPFAVLLVVASLCIHGAADSALNFFNSFAIPDRKGGIASRLESAFGVAIALTMATMVLDKVRVEWFFYLIAAQAFTSAVSDYITARHISEHHRTRWVYGAAAVSAMAGLASLAIVAFGGSDLTIYSMTKLIFGYLLVFGVVEMVTSARMLSYEGRFALSLHR